jgi:hypothetical protein
VTLEGCRLYLALDGPQEIGAAANALGLQLKPETIQPGIGHGLLTKIWFKDVCAQSDNQSAVLFLKTTITFGPLFPRKWLTQKLRERGRRRRGHSSERLWCQQQAEIAVGNGFSQLLKSALCMESGSCLLNEF